MAAGDVNQTTPVQNIHAFLLNKLSMCNFDSSKIFTCYMLCIDNKETIQLMSFGYFPWDFPSSRWLICCCTMLYYMLSAATVNGNEL